MAITTSWFSVVSLRKSRRARYLVVPILVALASGCARPAVFIHGQSGGEGAAQALVGSRGLTRVLVRREHGTEPWKRVLLRNDGTTRLRDIKLWGLGGADLFESAQPAREPNRVFRPFMLLPGERLACETVGPAADARKGLRGSFLWALAPGDSRIIAGGKPTRRVRLDPNNALRMDLSRGEQWVQWTFDSPMPHEGAQVMWETDPPDAQPSIWISLERGSVAKAPSPRAGRPWTQPVDFSSMIAGHHRFDLRLAFGARDPEDSDQALETTVTLKRIHVERQVSAPGRVREWREGLNELSVALKSKTDPKLAIRLF